MGLVGNVTEAGKSVYKAVENGVTGTGNEIKRAYKSDVNYPALGFRAVDEWIRGDIAAGTSTPRKVAINVAKVVAAIFTYTIGAVLAGGGTGITGVVNSGIGLKNMAVKATKHVWNKMFGKKPVQETKSAVRRGSTAVLNAAQRLVSRDSTAQQGGV